MVKFKYFWRVVNWKVRVRCAAGFTMSSSSNVTDSESIKVVLFVYP